MRTSVNLEPAENRVTITVDTGVYSRGAVMGAAYLFIDRCFVLLDAPGDNELSAVLRGREPMDEAALSSLVGEFGNELLAQELRQRLCDQNRPLLEAVVGGAIAGAIGPVVDGGGFDLAELEAMDLDDEPFEDPLGIAMSWEDKYGNKRASKSEAQAAKEAAAGASAGGEEGAGGDDDATASDPS